MRGQIRALRDRALRSSPGPLFLCLCLSVLFALAGCAEANRLTSAVGWLPTPTPVATPTATPAPLPALPPVVDLLQQESGGRIVDVGGWTSSDLTLSLAAQTQEYTSLVAQVEVAELDHPYSGVPTQEEPAIPVGRGMLRATVHVGGVTPGQYRWRARLLDPITGRAGPWRAYTVQAPSFGVVRGAPTLENVVLEGDGPNGARPKIVGQNDHPVLRWKAQSDPPEALDQIAYYINRTEAAPSTPPADSDLVAPDARLLPLEDVRDGQLYIHVWALNRAGMSSPPVTVPVRVLRSPLEISDLLYRMWPTTPQYQSVSIRFRISHPALVSLAILPGSGNSPIRRYDLGRQSSGEVIRADWDGKDNRGRYAEPGNYRFTIYAVDDAGNETHSPHEGVVISDKAILISLARQDLEAMQGSQKVVSTLVTTGGQELPTPTGSFEVLDKQSPFRFHSPFPPGSRYWYPDATVRWVMLFSREAETFIHDNGARTAFGPGTNGPGVPGGSTSGSHGCVNLPPAVMEQLYNWAPLGTPVIISP